MFSIYTTDGAKVTTGPDGKPYTDENAAETSVKDRNQRAESMGIQTRYKVGPAFKP